MYNVLKGEVRDGASEFALGPFLYSLVFIIRARRVLDLGTGHGFSMLSMALAMKRLYEDPFPTRQQHKQRKEINYERYEALVRVPLLVTVDYGPNPVVQELIQRYELDDYVEVVHGNIFGLSNRLSFNEWDIIFMDATKTAEELTEYIPLVREGGYFVVHDYFGSGISKLCEKLDGLCELEGLFFDTAYMSFKAYRVNKKVKREVLEAIFK